MGGLINSEDGSLVFDPGPLALIIDSMVERLLDYSPLICDRAKYVGRIQLSAIAKSMSPRPRVVIPGVKRPAGHAGDYLQAYALAVYARQLETNDDGPVVAIIFKDSDGTQSDERRRWNDLVAAIESGFFAAEFDRGVAMIARPKQEAWFLCAVKSEAYVNCAVLEEESGNDHSPNSLKMQLEKALGVQGDKEALIDLVKSGRFDFERVDMPSFARFVGSLRSVLAKVAPGCAVKRG